MKYKIFFIFFKSARKKLFSNIMLYIYENYLEVDFYLYYTYCKYCFFFQVKNFSIKKKFKIFNLHLIKIKEILKKKLNKYIIALESTYLIFFKNPKKKKNFLIAVKGLYYYFRNANIF